MNVQGAIAVEDAKSVIVGQIYSDGDVFVRIMARSVKLANEDMTVEIAQIARYDIATGEPTLTGWSVGETDKDGDLVVSDMFDNSEEAYFSYVERAFGINC